MRLISSVEAASLLGITPNTLKFWRCKGRGPAFIKLGESKQSGVAYDEADVLSWIEERKCPSTSAYSHAAKLNARHDVSRSHA